MKQRQVAQHRCGSVSTNEGRRKRGLAGLLAGASASAAALALSFAPQQVRAQAVNGTTTVVFGANAPTRSDTVDAFNVIAGEALIDWAVTDPSVFLNANTTLSFNGSEGPYTVLNRVVSSPSLASTLALNGRVQSDSAGKIWFYNPGGWAVGAGAVIDVGSLLLTASPVTVDAVDRANPGAPRFLGDNSEIRLGQATVAGASISIDPLANVSARGGDNSYVALVAPRVVQAGVVSSNGSVAYVGAEAADITINNGLFDIAVTAGTTDSNGVVHTGTTTGPASFGSTPRTQFFVAVGKNDAMTMLVRGQLGYDAADSAGFFNGRIVLSSGQGIVSNSPVALGTSQSSISISDAEFRNELAAAASDRIDVTVANSSQSVGVNGSAFLAARNAIEVSLSGSEAELVVLGDLNLSASSGANGGAVTIGLSNGGALFADNLFASADGLGTQQFDAETGILVPGAIGEAAQGGSVALTATNATVRVSGSTVFSADARGGIGGASAGRSTAGTVSLTASGSTVSLGESGVTLNARALSANSVGRNFFIGTTGAASTGGSATFDLSGGANLGAIILDNSAVASTGTDEAPQAASTGSLSARFASGSFSVSSIDLVSNVQSDSGGVASGGASSLTVSGANATFDNGITLFGEVVGDISTAPGAAGTASLTVGGGGSVTTSNVSLTRLAVGRVGGKNATAGDVTLAVGGGSSLSAAGGIFLRADGQGAQDFENPGGSGTGGNIGITVANGTLSAGSSISAQAVGIAGGDFSGVVTGETGRGGAISLSLSGANGLITASSVELSALGTAFFGEGTLGGTTGRGGTVGLTIGGGALRADAVELSADGEGGLGVNSFDGAEPAGRGGDAFGGTATLSLTGGALATDALSITAGANVPEFFDFGDGFGFTRYYGAGGYAFGDGGVAGAGGTGTGGTTAISIEGGQLTNRNGSGGSGASPLLVRLDSSGYGGNGGSTGGRSGIGAAKGDGGQGIGGTSTFEYLGGSADFLNLEAVASGRGGIGGFEQSFGESSARAPAPTGTSLGADGGDGRGGTALVRIAADLGAFDANGNRRLVIADATGVGGDAADGEMAGNGGNGFGGDATLEIDGATVSLIDPSIDATGLGGFGGRPGLSNPGGDGGAGFGGNATLSLSNGADFTLTGGALLAEGLGQDGRTGSDGGGNAAPGDGGKGGDGQGGNASLLTSGGSSLTLLQGEGGVLAFVVTGRAGDGGLGGTDIPFEGNSFGDGGDGGVGVGGGIVVEAEGTTLDLGFASFDADGFGGDGGGRVTGEGSASEFSSGGDGGEGQGGSVRLSAIGEGALLTFSSLDVTANGNAGDGATGQGTDATTFAGASGGRGLNGTGGSILLEAQGGGALTARTNDSSSTPGRVTLNASGFGGMGGDGANGATDPLTGVGGAGGNGGNSGQGNGGSISLVASGGTISLGEFRANANGVGRFGANGGVGGAGMVPPNAPPQTPPGASGADGVGGIGGGGVGGSIELSALTDEGGAVGGLSFGDSLLDVTGRMQFLESFSVQSVGGKVSIIDGVDDSNGGVRFGSLGIDATGDTTFQPFSVRIESSDGPIVVDNNLFIGAAGDVLIATTGTGGLDIGGSLGIESFGTVQIDDDFCGSECPSEATVSADSSIAIDAPGGNVLLIGGSTFASNGDISIDAGGSITGGPGSGYRTPGNLNLTAGGDIAVRNAEVGSLSAKAGLFLVELDEGELVEERYNARDLTFGEDGGGGRIVVNGDLSGLAGGDIAIASGAEIATGFGLSLVSGDNLIIGSGASLAANTVGRSEPGSLLLDAGGLDTVGEAIEGEVASLIVGSGASIDGGQGTVQLIGGAIDARGASISGLDVFADVRNPPSIESPQSDDGGQLATPCLEGDICLGSVTATGSVSIGQGDGAPVRFLGTGNISGNSVAIRSREKLTFGSTTAPLTTSAGGAISLESQSRDVHLLGGATLSGGSVEVSAGESLIGNGVLVSTGDVGITVGDSVNASAIIADGQLTGFGQTGGEAEGLFSVPGDFSVSTLRLGADATIAAGGDIVVDSASLGGNNLAFDAGGLVSLRSTAQVGDIALGGDRAEFGTLLAAGDIAIDAETSANGSNATSGGALSVNAATIEATTLASGGTMALNSSGATSIGSAVSGAGLAIDSRPLEFGSLTSTGSTSINATSVAGDSIDAGANLSIASPGAIDLAEASAGLALAIDGASITANALTSGGNAVLTAETLGIASIVSGGGIDVTGGAVALGSTRSAGPTRVDAGTLTLTSAIADGGLELVVDGPAMLGSAASGAQISILSGDLTFDVLGSIDETSIDAGSVAGGEIEAGSSLSLVSSGSVGLDSASAGTTLAVDGASIIAGLLTSGSDTTVNAETIDVGRIVSGGEINVRGRTVELGSTQSGGLTKVGAGTLTLSSAIAGGGLELAVDGPATLGTATSGAQISIQSGALTFGSVTAAGATSIEAASVSGDSVAAGRSLSVVSTGAIDIDEATAGTTVTLDGSSLTANRVISGSDATLTAGIVDIGSAISGGGIDVAGRRVELGSTQSAGLTKIRAGALTLSSANAEGRLELAVQESATVGSVTSGAQITIQSGNLAFASLTSGGATSIDASSVAGGDIEAGSSLAVVADGAIGLSSASAGTSLALDGASIAASSLTSGGDTSLSAGIVDVASAVSGGGIDVTGGSVAIGSAQSVGLTKVGAETLTLSSASADGGLELAVEGDALLGTVRSGGSVNAAAGDLRFTAIIANGDIAASASTIGGGDATSTAGAVALTSSGPATVGQLQAATDVSVTASTFAFAGVEAPRDVTLDIGTLNGSVIDAGRDLTIRSDDGLTFGNVGAGRNVLLSSSNGGLTITTDLNAGGAATLLADAIRVQAAGDLRINGAGADNGNILIVTDGLLRVDSATAIGDIALTSTAGSLIVGGAVAGESPNVGTALTTEATATPGVIGAGAIALGAANDITLLGTVDAVTSLAATAGRLIDQRGLAVGRTISYRSADIALAQGASLGQSNFTTGIALANTGSAGAILGDVAGSTAGYRLDNAEFARIHSGGDLSLTGGSALSVGTLSASAATGSGGIANGNIGATSALSLSTSGELGVSGALALANAGGNTLNLTSGGALFVDAGSGSIRLVEGSASGGTLAVSAGSIMALTPAARAAIAALDTRALDQRLSMNDGVTANRTVLEGGAITLSSDGAILIQNTSPGISFDERRGFVADSLTLITRGESSSLADIVINGTVAGTTGLTALRAVEIDGSFSDFSTINGCRIVSASCGNPAIDPIRDLIEEEVEVGSTLENSADGFGQAPLMTISRIDPVGFETVIDEPVTGAGNDDFLVPEAGAGDEVCTADDQTKCDKPPVG